jgi:hypothetical protein
MSMQTSGTRRVAQSLVWGAVGLASGLVSTGAWGQSFACALQQPGSSATYALSVNAPYVLGTNATTGLPNSFLIGNWDAVTNPAGTRTIPGLTGGNISANTPVAITAGGISASGSSGSTPLLPTGSFQISLDPGANRAEISGLAVELLPAGSSVSIAGNISITFGTFRTRQPTCTVPGGFPISVPQSLVLTGLPATQDGLGVGTLTTTGPNQYSFSVPMVVEVAPVATINGAPAPLAPTLVPVVVTGVATITGNGSVTVTGSLPIQINQITPGPTPVSPLAFTVPLCSGNLLVNITLGDVTTTITSTTSFAATGTQVVVCDSVDFNNDTLTPDSGDLDDFLAVLGGGPGACSTAPVPGCNDLDFNNDGLFPDSADLDAFVSRLAGGACL